MDELRGKLPPEKQSGEYNPRKSWKTQGYCSVNQVNPTLYETSNVPGSRTDKASQIIRQLSLQSLCPKSCPVRGHCALEGLQGGAIGMVMGGVAIPNDYSTPNAKRALEQAERKLSRVIIERAVDEGLPVVRSRREALRLMEESK